MAIRVGAVSRNGLCGSVPRGASASSHSCGARPLVEFLLFGFGGQANALFDGRVGHDDEVPGLQIGAAGRSAGRAQAIFDDLGRQRPVGKRAHRAPAPHLGIKVGGPLLHLVGRELVEVQWNELVVGHGGFDVALMLLRVLGPSS